MSASYEREFVLDGVHWSGIWEGSEGERTEICRYCRKTWSTFHDKETGLCKVPLVETRSMAIPKDDSVEHPTYYGGKDNPYEVIKVIDDWGLGFKLGSAVKYIARAGKKNPTTEIQDLKKAVFYINHTIEELERRL